MQIRIIGTPGEVRDGIARITAAFPERPVDCRIARARRADHTRAYLEFAEPVTVPAAPDKTTEGLPPDREPLRINEGTISVTHTTDPPVSTTSTQLATAGQDFDWTRRLDAGVRGLVTTWLEIGERAIRHITIVTPAGGAR